MTLRTGGPAFSLPVIVQAGSVRQPCGTTKLKNPDVNGQTQRSPRRRSNPGRKRTGRRDGRSAGAAPPLPAAPAPAPHPHPAGAVLRPARRGPVHPRVRARAGADAGPPDAAERHLRRDLARRVQKEEEEEAAPESVSNEAVAYRQSEHEPAPHYLLGVILLAAFAGASIRGRPSRRRRGVAIAPATITAINAQRRMSRRADRP